jgi:replication initiation and membrane attachment protein DnaB
MMVVQLHEQSEELNWYDGSKFLVNYWARIIGPDAFLLYHHFKSMGYAGGPETSFSFAVKESDSMLLLGMSRERFESAKETLLSVGLLIIEQGDAKEEFIYTFPNPKKVPLPTEKETLHV